MIYSERFARYAGSGQGHRSRGSILSLDLQVVK